MRLFWCYFFQVLGLVFVMISGVSRSRKRILGTMFLANFCSILTMFLAGRFDGGISAAVCTLRTFLFLFRDRVKGNGICWLCVGAHLVTGILAWQSSISILVVVAPVVLTLSQWFGSVNGIKYGTMFSDLCWAVFDFSGGIYIEGLRDLSSVCFNVIGLLRGRNKSEKHDS